MSEIDRTRRIAIRLTPEEYEAELYDKLEVPYTRCNVYDSISNSYTIIAHHPKLKEVDILYDCDWYSLQKANEFFPFLFKQEKPEEPNLKPCPMCGGDSIFFTSQNVNGSRIRCDGCGLATGLTNKSGWLIDKWNDIIRRGDDE